MHATGVQWEPVPGREGVDTRFKVELPKVEGEPAVVQEPEEKDIIRRHSTTEILINRASGKLNYSDSSYRTKNRMDQTDKESVKFSISENGKSQISSYGSREGMDSEICI